MKRFRISGEDQGSAAVEFALVLPVLMLILFGIIDFGRMLNARIVISQAAHEGARAAAVTGDVDVAAQTIAKVMGSMAGRMDDPSIEGCNVAMPLDGEATVTVRYHFGFVTPLALFGGFGDEDGMTISSTAVVPCL